MNKRATTDPVCGMELREHEAKEFLFADRQEYFFCSVGCRAEFERHPEDYTRVDDGAKNDV